MRLYSFPRITLSVVTSLTILCCLPTESGADDDSQSKTARTHAEVYNDGVSQYRLGRFDEAAERFRIAGQSIDQDLAAKARYNLGNCHYARALKHVESGEGRDTVKPFIQDAINSYREALRLNPIDDDARANLELALHALAQITEPDDTNPLPNQDQQNQDSQEQEDQQNESENNQQQNPEGPDRREEEKAPPQEESSERDESDQNDNPGSQQPEQQSESQDPPRQESPDDQANDSGKNQNSEQQDSEQQNPTNQDSENSDSLENAARSEQNERSKSDRQSSPTSSDPSGDPQDIEDQPPEPPTDSRGQLEAADGDQDEPPASLHQTADGDVDEGKVMTQQEAMKMLQSIRDRDMMRRFRIERAERSRYIPVDRDW